MSSGTSASSAPLNDLKCPISSRVPQGFGYKLLVVTKVTTDDTSDMPYQAISLKNCAIPCKHNLLDNYEKYLFTILLIFSILSLAILFFGFLNQILRLSSKSTQLYPEKATFHILICHLVISFCILISILKQSTFSCHSINGQEFRVQNNNTIACTIIHSLLLYFFIANQLWWLIYCICIYMISKAEWISETISRKSFYFHCIAWILPAIILFFSLIFESINSDLATGICFIDIQRVSHLALLFVVPFTLCLVFGLILIAISFFNFLTIRRQLLSASSSAASNNSNLPNNNNNGNGDNDNNLFKKQLSNISENNQINNFNNDNQEDEDDDDDENNHIASNQLNSMDAYLFRTLCFVSFYLILSVALLCTFLIESNRRPKWLLFWHYKHCFDNNNNQEEDCGTNHLFLSDNSNNNQEDNNNNNINDNNDGLSDLNRRTSKEIFIISLLKYFAWQFVGWSTLIWIFSPKILKKILRFRRRRRNDDDNNNNNRIGERRDFV